jgi:hypothetical protein
VRSFRRIAALLALPLVASAEPVRVVDHARLSLGDIIANPPEGTADLDLGPAPPPGSSRLLTHDELERQLRGRGLDLSKISIPASIRIVAAARRISPDKLSELAAPLIEKLLPPGVKLTSVRASYEVVVPPRTEVQSAEPPRYVRQKGVQRSTTTVQLISDGAPVARVPVTIVLEVSEEAARPDVARSGRINLSFERGLVRVSAAGTVMADANVGDKVGVLVVSTGKVVRAKIVSTGEAEVLDGP